MSDPRTNKALVAEFIDALFTNGDLEAVDRYLAPGFVNHDPFPGFAPDREGMRQTAQVFRQAFPDWHAGTAGPHRRGRPGRRTVHRPRNPPGRARASLRPGGRSCWRGSTSSASRTASSSSAGAAPTIWASCSSSGSSQQCRLDKRQRLLAVGQADPGLTYWRASWERMPTAGWSRAAMSSGGRWAGAGWARCGGPTTSCLAGRWRSRRWSCRAGAGAGRERCANGRSARPGRRPGSTTRGW